MASENPSRRDQPHRQYPLGDAGMPEQRSEKSRPAQRNGRAGKRRSRRKGAPSRRLEMTENGRRVLEARYLRNGETPEGLFRRVARAIADGEAPDDREYWGELFEDMLLSLKFLPNSPTIRNAGDGEAASTTASKARRSSPSKGCLSACFCISPEDSMDSIMQVAYDAAMVEKWGGGIGFGFSRLRPRNDYIRTTHGVACGPVAVMRLYSKVGDTLTQGAFRLGAHMGQLGVWHPDVREFIHCKDKDDALSNFNISVQMTDDFMRAVADDRDWSLVSPRTGEVTDTLKARDLWREICESAWKTGDPGVVFMDRVWETQPNPQLGDIQTSNPCVTGDTLVFTGDGLTTIKELVGKTPALSLDSRSGAESSMAMRIWCSGVKPVYRLITKEGYTLRLTADHRVFTLQGKVPAGELKPGDQIRLVDHKGGFGSSGNRELGLVLGWLTGDGHIDIKRAVLSFYGADQALGSLLSEATQTVVAGQSERPTRTYPTTMHVTSAGRGMIQSTRLKDLVAGYGLTEEHWHHVPQVVYQGTEEMQRAYLQALFGADGTVAGTGPEKGVSVRLNSSARPLLEGVQRLLLNFGIASRICQRRDARQVLMPDGKGTMKKYQTLANYEVIIGKDTVRRFADEIGFLSEQKNQRLQEALARYGKRGLYRERFLATFERLEYEGEEAVYDLTEPLTHSFVANGFCISNCGEEFLEDYGNCCLGSIDLSKHVHEEAGDFDWPELERTVRLAIRFLDDVIEVNTFPVSKLREVNLATRRVGLGVMGWADALIRLGLPYDSHEALEKAEQVGNFIWEKAWDTSARLAQERGPYPEYERSALRERGTPPVRNSSVLTIAPTGTISLLAGCSSGIEPHFAMAWTRRALWQDQEGTSVTLVEAPGTVRQSLSHQLGEEQAEEALKQVAESPDVHAAQDVLRGHGVDPGVFRTSMLVSAPDHVRMQAAWQRYTSNSVSKTINLPQHADVEDVARAFHLAWELGCKAVTVYRDQSKSMQVLETGRGDRTSGRAGVVPRERPATISGRTERIRTGHGNMYVTVNFDERDRPFEVFTTLGKAGGCDSAQLEAISRLVSLALRSGISPEDIVEQLRGITCCPAWDQGVLVRSAPDAVVLALDRATRGEREESYATQLSMLQRADYGASDPSGNGNGGPPGGSYGSARCPDCAESLVFQEGCLHCMRCGYTRCG